MSLRAKLLIVFIVGSLAPVLLVGALFYRNSARAVEEMLREEAEAKTAGIARDIETALREREVDLSELAQNGALRDYTHLTPSQPTGEAPPGEPSTKSPARAAAETSLAGFISQHRDRYSAITFVNASGVLKIRFEAPAAAAVGSAPLVKTGDLLPGQPRLDERIWTITERKPLRSNVTRDATGTPCIVFTAPVFSDGNGARSTPVAALVAELKLDSLFEEAGSHLNAAPAAVSPAFAGRAAGAVQASRLLLVLDSAGQVVYHTNHALKYQPISAAMPYFDAAAREMQAGKAATTFYHVPADGTRWLVAYKPVAGGNLAVAAAVNYTRAVESVNRGALTVVALALAIAAAALLLLFAIVTRTSRRISRVTEAAAAIAAGDLNQHVETEASDETHELVEGFNRMSDRLRELIAREAETRQFQSFVRLSAMLTHDLKNSITGLSMLVTNMERQYHRAEFREDAISSLRQATEKLGSLVARLSEPVKSLSGEYRAAPRPADLVPVIRRALETTAVPSAAFYDIQSELPDELIAHIDADRIERVVENLVVNAFEAMGSRGGRLTVAAGVESEDLVFFSVEDTGPGMTEDFMRTRLFRAFATTKRRGIGLGLYTCREIVESHGGRLEVKSKLGSGTRFRVVLPSIPLMASHARSTGKPVPEKAETTKTSAAG